MNGKKLLRVFGLIGLIGLIGVAPLQAQLVIPRSMTLLSAQTMTNGGTYTWNVSTNFIQAMATTHTARLVAVLQPAAPNSPTNGNFTTNVVLTFNYQVLAGGATNTTTDVPFTWTIATNQIGNLAVAPWTNTVTIQTNLPTVDSLFGLTLATAVGSGTNAVGYKLSLYLDMTP